MPPQDRLSPDDISQAARDLGCEPEVLRAVLDVEAAGSGFDSNGRCRVLFEPHVFYRQLGGNIPLRDQAVAEGLAYPQWRPGAYPNEDGVWDQIERACEISEDAALQSCSWGIGQVMGYHWAGTIYNSVQDLVADMCRSEKAQLALMVSFIIRSGLDRHLKAKDWRAFARGYNGAGYEANRYHIKLEEAYRRHVAPQGGLS